MPEIQASERAHIHDPTEQHRLPQCVLVRVCPFRMQYNFPRMELCSYFSLFAVWLLHALWPCVTKGARPRERKKGGASSTATSQLINLEVYYFTHAVYPCGSLKSLRNMLLSHFKFSMAELETFSMVCNNNNAPSSSSSSSSSSSPHQQTTST